MITDICNMSEKDFIINKLVEYNLSQVGSSQKESLDLSKKIVENGEIIGGILAQMYCWNIVHVEILWVDSRYRGQDLGSQLLDAVESHAKSHGAVLIHLDTFDFQAKAFYEKHGYTVFGVLKDCPQGHSRFYLEKRL